MLTVPHAVVGATIASKIPNPLIAYPLVIVSHFLLDFFIPHWNPRLYTEYHKKGALSKTTKRIIFIDGFFGLLLTTLIAFLKLPNLNQTFYVLLGAAFGVLPDAIEIPHYFFGLRSNLLFSYIKIGHRHQAKASFFPGLLTQLLVVIFCLAIIFI
jgi:hypothetical protein